MFSQLGLTPTTCASLARLGYTIPTPIQTKAIPVVLTGVDLLARAQTGTGKTAAFGLPMIQRLTSQGAAAGRVKPRALVLVPTRELALQVSQTLSGYAASTRLRVVAIYGGVGMGGQMQALRRGTDIIVATPGRLIDHMQRKTVDLSGIEVLTLDEADRMLDMGFQPALKRILPALPRQRQTLLFSATLEDGVVGLSAEFTRNPTRVDVSTGQVVASNVTH
jgi:ATP-dependent RNA helicase RhlE